MTYRLNVFCYPTIGYCINIVILHYLTRFMYFRNALYVYIYLSFITENMMKLIVILILYIIGVILTLLANDFKPNLPITMLIIFAIWAVYHFVSKYSKKITY